MFDGLAKELIEMQAYSYSEDILAYDIMPGDYFIINDDDDQLIAKGLCFNKTNVDIPGIGEHVSILARVYTSDPKVITVEDYVIAADEIVNVTRYVYDNEPAVFEGHTRLYRFAIDDSEAIGAQLFYSFEPLWQFSQGRTLYLVDVPTEDLDNAVDLDEQGDPWTDIDWESAPNEAGWYVRNRMINEAILNSDEAISRVVLRSRVDVPQWEKG